MSAIQGKHLVTSRARICYVLVACWTLVALITVARSGEVADGQTFYDVSFSADGELSSNAELVRRFLSPLTVASSAAAPAGQAVNIADERFVVYVPAHHAPHGYGLIVFISPWQEAGVPRGWAEVLSQFNCIFVSAARSGNEEKALSRRAASAIAMTTLSTRLDIVDALRSVASVRFRAHQSFLLPRSRALSPRGVAGGAT